MNARLRVIGHFWLIITDIGMDIDSDDIKGRCDRPREARRIAERPSEGGDFALDRHGFLLRHFCSDTAENRRGRSHESTPSTQEGTTLILVGSCCILLTRPAGKRSGFIYAMFTISS